MIGITDCKSGIAVFLLVKALLSKPDCRDIFFVRFYTSTRLSVTEYKKDIAKSRASIPKNLYPCFSNNFEN